LVAEIQSKGSLALFCYLTWRLVGYGLAVWEMLLVPVVLIALGSVTYMIEPSVYRGPDKSDTATIAETTTVVGGGQEKSPA